MSVQKEPAFPSWPDGYKPAAGVSVRVWLMANAPVPGFVYLRGEFEDIARRNGDPAPFIPDAKVIAEQARLARLWADAIIKEAERG